MGECVMAFEVRQPEIEETLKDIGNLLRRAMPEGWGFSLLIFSFGPGGSLFYTSSGERESVISAMREFIAKVGSN